MDDYFDGNFTSKKKDKKYKVDQIVKFKDFVQDKLDEQFEGVLEFVEETMDH